MSLRATKPKPLELQPIFPQLAHSKSFSGYIEAGREILEDLLPEEFFSFSREKAEKWLLEKLPLAKWDSIEVTPGSLTLRFLCAPTHEIKAEKVLLDVIQKWLIPEKEVKILGFKNLYFYMRGISSRLFFVAEVSILVEDAKELSLIEEHLPLLSSELGLSLSSRHYHENILDTKGLSLDQKSSQIQMYLRKLAGRAPRQFETDIFREMSTFFALSKPDFRKFRMPKHLTRVIVSHYLMRKKMLHQLSVSPERRHLEFRFVRSKLYFPFGTKPVLGLSLAVALTNRYETFEESHILDAVQKFVPDFQVVKGSYYFYRANYDPIKYIYLELEKKDGSSLLPGEVRLLNRELKEELKKRIEQLIPSVFMIRNEEEVMRNILLLSQELKYLSDLPQVMINFEKQEGEELVFTVLVVRVLKKHDQPLEQLFNAKKQNFRYIPDRVQNVGYIRKKNPKEANVFHICIPKHRSILRANSSVNFYLARGKIMEILVESLGDVRDYNGGMILKQGELFSRFKEAFSRNGGYDHELLENFFFGLTPIESQATTSLTALKTLYQLCLEASVQELPKRESCFQKITKRKNTCFAILRAKDRSLEKILNNELNQLENFSKALVKTQVSHQGTLLQGVLYESSSKAQQKQFQKAIEQSIEKWKSNILNQQELRLSFIDLPLSLDPRLGGDEYSSNVTRMLFEGLTRISRGNKPALALAKSLEISPDQKKYIFTLRPTKWSDGSPLVARQFEYAWKKILSPSFYTPFAYFFYPIKNAKAAKLGNIDIDKVGVKATSDYTLEVDLENPTPEFLEQIAHPLFSPINDKLEKLHPNWAQSGAETYICNGPMRLQTFQPNGGFVFVKNPHYWDQQSVKLNKILISKNNAETAIEMYNNNEIDWLGFPMHPWESYFSIEDKENYTKFLGTHWCVFNTQRYPFDNLKMRQAFTYAINRELISQEFSSTTFPAITPLPHTHTSIFNKDIIYGDKRMAVQLFEEALKEVGLVRKNFPILTLYFAGGRSREVITNRMARAWEEIFGISCRVEEYSFHILFPKLSKGDFQLGMIHWKSWINDPFYTLGAFQYRTSRVNFSKWEHPEYQKNLERASIETISANRTEYFKKAEETLIEECPVLPIFHEAYRYSHKPELQGAFCSDSGNIDFKWASIAPR
ncbi:MAG: peptide ABC transporter substrate-binding protein [Simkaniaceae bacterium]|nr:peptide ABC transporter substrate-binding protein [Candidatus Sacchlamyda saccharinae]